MSWQKIVLHAVVKKDRKSHMLGSRQDQRLAMMVGYDAKTLERSQPAP
jgi:hypothetical protein